MTAVKRMVLGLILIAAAACSSYGAPAAAVTASSATGSRITYPGTSSTEQGGHYALMQSGPNYVDLVDVIRPRVVTREFFTPPSFRPNPFVSWTSTSETRAYVLTATGEVEFLTPDEDVQRATTISFGPTQEAGFAVSPDDKRIAVAIFSYGDHSGYVGMRLYVEDLAGGGNHFDIFTSTTVAEFPIGWVRGNLIVAVSEPHCCIGTPDNPYAAEAYHVVDPSSGRRLASLCASSDPIGPIEPVGTMCRGVNGPPQFLHWDGSSFPAPTAVTDPGQYGSALSPDGTQVLVGGAPIRVERGPQADVNFGINGYAAGWIDMNHVVIKNAEDNTYWLMDPRNAQGAQVVGETGFLGTVPVAVS